MPELDQLAAQIRACQRCRLAQTRGQAVPGEGPENAPILLIGEGPGAQEDRQGRPFVGRSGALLEKLPREGLTGKTLKATGAYPLPAKGQLPLLVPATVTVGG